MDDDADGLVTPFDILHTYSQAGAFVEARLARLKADPQADPEAVADAEGLSTTLFDGIAAAVLVMEEAMGIEEEPQRMLC